MSWTRYDYEATASERPTSTFASIPHDIDSEYETYV